MNIILLDAPETAAFQKELAKLVMKHGKRAAVFVEGQHSGTDFNVERAVRMAKAAESAVVVVDAQRLTREAKVVLVNITFNKEKQE